jgi:hypothetical protein
MTEREQFDYREKKLSILAHYHYRCTYPGCKKRAVYLAHRIAKTKHNLEIYGPEVIHHELNVMPVCEIQAHNDCWNIDKNHVEKRKLVARIKQMC